MIVDVLDVIEHALQPISRVGWRILFTVETTAVWFATKPREVHLAQVRDFVLNVGELEYIDSAGLEALLKLQETCADLLGQVRLTGVAEVVTERPLLQEIWDANPLMRQYLGSLDNPSLIVYRVRPTRVRFMREWALDYHEVPFESTTG